jgi:hypothetical protein
MDQLKCSISGICGICTQYIHNVQIHNDRLNLEDIMLCKISTERQILHDLSVES